MNNTNIGRCIFFFLLVSQSQIFQSISTDCNLNASKYWIPISQLSSTIQFNSFNISLHSIGKRLKQSALSMLSQNLLYHFSNNPKHVIILNFIEILFLRVTNRFRSFWNSLSTHNNYKFLRVISQFMRWQYAFNV